MRKTPFDLTFDELADAGRRASEKARAEWAEHQRRDARNYGIGIVRTDAEGNTTRIAPEDFFT